MKDFNLNLAAFLQRSYRGLNSAKITYIHSNLSRVCPPPFKMAPETVKKSIGSVFTYNTSAGVLLCVYHIIKGKIIEICLFTNTSTNDNQLDTLG